MIAEAPRPADVRPAAEPARAAAIHSPDFSVVVWQGRKFFFTRLQARVVAALWRAREDGYDAVRMEALLKAADSDQKRLRDLFARGDHPAWGTLIVASDGLRGGFQLNVDGER